MTDTKSAAKPGQLKETERITQGAGPGRGPMGGGMVGQKASTFGPSAKRLVGQLRPQRLKVFLVLLLAVVSVALMSIGPRILGRATDLIFAGVLGRNIPEGVTQEQAAEALRAQGDVRQADLIANTDNLVPGQGVDFAAVGDVLMLVLVVYVVASLLAWLQGYILNDVVQATVRRMRADVEDKVNTLPLSYFDRQPRGELLSRVTNDIDNVSQSLQQTMSQLLTSLLTVVFVVVMMFTISWQLALVALVTVPVTMIVTGAVMKRSQGMFIDQWRRTGQAQRPHRGDLLGPRAGQGLRPPGGGRADLRRGERPAVRGVVRRSVRQRADHADDDVHREPQLRRHRGPRRDQGRQRVDQPR